jgi:hypothetical protein
VYDAMRELARGEVHSKLLSLIVDLKVAVSCLTHAVLSAFN